MLPLKLHLMTVEEKKILWGWTDSNGYNLQWFDNQRIARESKPKFNTQGTRSGRIQTSRPNFTDKDRNEKRYDRKDNQRLSTGDRRPSSQPVRPPYRGSRPVGTGVNQGRTGAPQGRRPS